MKTRALFFPPVEIARHLFRPVLARQDESFAKIFLPLVMVVAVVWWVTVPLHELLHAAGCVLFGGGVEELTIQSYYGGGILEKVFPFVRSGGAYAGQLTVFDTGGSDLCYFVTSFFPFLLTVFLGVPMLVLALKKESTVLHGIGFVHAVLPVVALPGDFYEMGSIVTTRLMGLPAGSAGAELIRGDDFFLVLGEFGPAAASAGLSQAPVPVLAALGLGVLFCFVTLDLSLLLARVIGGRKPLEIQTRQV